MECENTLRLHNQSATLLENQKNDYSIICFSTNSNYSIFKQISLRHFHVSTCALMHCSTHPSCSISLSVCLSVSNYYLLLYDRGQLLNFFRSRENSRIQFVDLCVMKKSKITETLEIRNSGVQLQ